jgi:hypothetical protein
VSCFACGALVLADFGFSALRFIVAVIAVLAFALVLDLDVVPAACGDSADDGAALAGACFGPCSAALLEWIKIIAAALNGRTPSRKPRPLLIRRIPM